MKIFWQFISSYSVTLLRTHLQYWWIVVQEIIQTRKQTWIFQAKLKNTEIPSRIHLVQLCGFDIKLSVLYICLSYQDAEESIRRIIRDVFCQLSGRVPQRQTLIRGAQTIAKSAVIQVKPRKKFSTQKAGKCRDTLLRDVVELAFLKLSKFSHIKSELTFSNLKIIPALHWLDGTHKCPIWTKSFYDTKKILKTE